jgi:hypothetical protein
MTDDLEAPGVDMTDEGGIDLPNVIWEDDTAEPCWDHQLLSLLQDTSDHNADKIIKLANRYLPPTEERQTGTCGNGKKKQRKMKRRNTTNSSFNDPRLGGGGVAEYREKAIKALYYCSNERKVNGELCMILLPDGHSGPCPLCHVACSDTGGDGEESFHSRDLVVDLAEHYRVVARQDHTDVLQLICDYDSIAQERLSRDPDDPDARVQCPLSGLVARRDYKANPKVFQVDVEAKAGEYAILNHGHSPEEVYVVKEEADGYIVRTCQGEKVKAEKEKVEKLGGHFPWDVVVFDDGSDVHNNLSMPYSNDSKTERLECIPEKFRDVLVYNAWLGTTCGGRTWPNTRQRQVWYEKQRRRLSEYKAIELDFTVKVWYNGRLCIVHGPSMTRNELFGVYDHKAAEKLMGMNGPRNAQSAKVILDDFEAYSSSKHAVYSFLHAKVHKGSSCLPLSKEKSDKKHQDAEDKLGTPEWEAHRLESGAMYQPLPAAGSVYHDLAPDPNWTAWARMDFGRAHGQGIVDNLFREFLLSLAPKAKRKALSGLFDALRHPRGSSKGHGFYSDDGDFTQSGEQLIKKRAFRTRYMGVTLVKLFDDGTLRSEDCMKVSKRYTLNITLITARMLMFLKFLRTWRLYTALTTPSKEGFGKVEFEQVLCVVRSCFITQKCSNN